MLGPPVLQAPYSPDGDAPNDPMEPGTPDGSAASAIAGDVAPQGVANLPAGGSRKFLPPAF